jgi:hypothetical protein
MGVDSRNVAALMSEQSDLGDDANSTGPVHVAPDLRVTPPAP